MQNRHGKQPESRQVLLKISNIGKKKKKKKLLKKMKITGMNVKITQTGNFKQVNIVAYVI